MARVKLTPTHPGEVLLEEFLKPMGISQYKLAKDIGVPQARISKIIKGERSITPDTALRLSRYFNMSAEFWINFQASYDLKVARQATGKSIISMIDPLDFDKAA